MKILFSMIPVIIIALECGHSTAEGVDYLLTTSPGTNVNPGTIASSLNYAINEMPPISQTYYIRLSYSSEEATSWGTIYTGNFDISIGDSKFGNIKNVLALDSDGYWLTKGVTTGIASQSYYGNFVNDEYGWTPDSSPPPKRFHYLTLGQFELQNVSTHTLGTTQVNVTIANTGVDYPGGWNTGGPLFYPKDAGFKINVVPEPSLFIPSSLICLLWSVTTYHKTRHKVGMPGSPYMIVIRFIWNTTARSFTHLKTR